MVWTVHELTGRTVGLSSVVKLQVPLGGLGAAEGGRGRVGEEEGRGLKGWSEGMENEYIHLGIMIFIFESTVYEGTTGNHKPLDSSQHKALSPRRP